MREPTRAELLKIGERRILRNVRRLVAVLKRGPYKTDAGYTRNMVALSRALVDLQNAVEDFDDMQRTVKK